MQRQGLPLWDWYEHLPGIDFPSGRGGRTTSAGSGIAPLGTRVILHAIIPLTSAAGNLRLRKGDGTTVYHTIDIPVVAASIPGGLIGIDMLLTDGLCVAGGSTGGWLVCFSLV